MSDWTDSEIRRFWWNVTYSEKGCWVWQGKPRADGYGLFRIGGRQERAHRVAWTMFNGPIADGLKVCHRCDNPPCCRPDHLFLGTQPENLADMTAKGRRAAGPRHQWFGQNQSGEVNHAARLTAAKVADIRAMGLAGYRERDIAERFNVNPGTIGYVLRGQTWKGIAPSAPMPKVERTSFRPRLDAEAARVIRRTYSGHRGELTELANHYGVARSTIGRIVSGRTYSEQ